MGGRRVGNEIIGAHIPKNEAHLLVEAMIHIKINHTKTKLMKGDQVIFK